MNEKEITSILQKLNDIPLPSKDKILANCEMALNQKSTVNAYASPRRRALVAASICLFVLVSLWRVNVFALEHQEYIHAVEFFEQNGLSSDGFSRNEIKRICKDITSENFTYELTIKAICHSLGMEGLTNETSLSPQELKALWERKQQEEDLVISHIQNGLAVSGSIAERGISFLFKVQIRNTDILKDTYSILEKYTDGELEWSKVFYGLSISKVIHASGHTVVAGMTSNDTTNRTIMLLSEDGEPIWQNPVEDFSNILIEKNEICVIGNGKIDDPSSFDKAKNKLYLALFDMDGNLIRSVSETFYRLNFDYIQYLESSYQEPSYSVDKAIKVGDAYYLVLRCHIYSGKNVAKSQMSIVRISADGHFEAMYEVNEPGVSHRITDIAIKGNRLYIGGYCTPSDNGPLNNGLLVEQSEELNRIKATLLAADGAIENQTLLQMLKEHYTGFVICYDTKTEETVEIQTAPGAIDTTFDRTSNGSLIWVYRSVADARYSIIDNEGALWAAAPYAKIEIVFQDTSFPLG